MLIGKPPNRLTRTPDKARFAAVKHMLSTFHLIPLAVVAAGLYVSTPQRVPALDWPHWRGPNHNGISAEKGWLTSWPKEGLKTLWKAKVGIGFSAVTVSAGKAYTMGNAQEKDTVFCFDATTGAVIWKHSYPAPLDPRYYDGGASCTPTVDGSVVYTLSRRGILLAMDAATGAVRWEKNLAKDLSLKVPEWGFAGAPLVRGKLLILNAGGLGTAVDKSSGEVIWTNGKESAGYSAALPYSHFGKDAVAFAALQHIAAVETATGKVLWKFPWETQYDINAADPIIQGEEVFVSSGYEHAGAVLRLQKAGDPTQLWKNKSLKTQFSTAVVIDGHIYGVDGNTGRDCTLTCLEWRTGAVKWQKKGVGMGSLMAADGKLIIQWEKGELVLVSARADKYEELSRAQVMGGKSWTQPVLANGKIYVRNATGDVVCVDVSGR